MDIKYTIEILTKDIQDIENLVGKLQNSKEASAIELDLAMSKLRNVYEILTMIKADRLNELVDPSPGDTETVPETQAEPGPEDEAVAPDETAPETGAKAPDETAPEVEAMDQPASEPKETSILAEKFRTESSINENLADSRGEPQETKLMGQPIDNIARNIGINDRFLIIRELFDGNSEGFSSLIANLDGAENYQNAQGLLEEHFAGSMDHEGVEILSGLVKRRYLR